LREIFRDFGCGSAAAASCENRRFQLLKIIGSKGAIE